MPLAIVKGQVSCPKRFWAGMARDACCREQFLGLCPPDCDEGARAMREARQFWSFVIELASRRKRFGRAARRKDELPPLPDMFSTLRV